MPDLPDPIVAALVAGVFVSMTLIVQTAVAWRAFTQRATNDYRDQQWKRVQWAVDLSLKEGEREQWISSEVLASLAQEVHVEKTDYLVIDSAVQSQKERLAVLEAEAEAVLEALSAQDYDTVAMNGSDEATDPGQDHTRD